MAVPRWPFARAGPGNAYSLMVNDDNWKQDKFRITLGGNNFTLDYLNAGDSFEHECAATKPAQAAQLTPLHARLAPMRSVWRVDSRSSRSARCGTACARRRWPSSTAPRPRRPVRHTPTAVCRAAPRSRRPGHTDATLSRLVVVVAVMHLSNSLPEIRVLAKEDKLEGSLLLAGRSALHHRRRRRRHSSSNNNSHHRNNNSCAGFSR